MNQQTQQQAPVSPAPSTPLQAQQMSAVLVNALGEIGLARPALSLTLFERLFAQEISGDAQSFVASCGQGPIVYIRLCAQACWAVVSKLLGEASSPLPSRPLTSLERHLLLGPIEKIAAGALGQQIGGASERSLSIEAIGSPGLSLDPNQCLRRAVYELAIAGADKPASVELLWPVNQALELSCCKLEPACGPAAQPGAGLLELSLVIDTQVQDQAKLLEGDVLVSDIPAQGSGAMEVVIRVAGIPKYVGKLGTHAGRAAVLIKRPVGQAHQESPQPPQAAQK